MSLIGRSKIAIHKSPITNPRVRLGGLGLANYQKPTAKSPAGLTRLNALTSISQGKLTSTAGKAIGAIPVGPEIYKLGVNGAGTTFVKDVVKTPLAEKALGAVAGTIFSTVLDIKLAWDGATYAYGLVKCW